jgi:hypothetical protein
MQTQTKIHNLMEENMKVQIDMQTKIQMQE